MRSSRLTFLVSLLLSAAVHATLIWQLPKWAQPGTAAAPKPQAYRVAPPGSLPDPPPPPPPQTALGESKGQGEAINSSPGDTPQSAPQSVHDQAVWTRDPTGQGPGDQQARSSPPKPMQQAVVTQPPSAVPTLPVSKLPAFKKPPPPQPKAPTADETKDNPPTQTPAPPRPTPPTPAPQQPPAPPAQAGGTPLPHSDQDSDLFAKEVTVEFKRGQVVAAPGRQVKFTRPKLNLATMVESAEITLPARLRFRITVAADGSARKVDIVRSSGSPSIDRAFLLAAYESWYEPAKDAAGRPVSDKFEFNVSIE